MTAADMVANPTPDYRPEARRWLAVPYVVDGVLVYVEQIDHHFAHAKNAGAIILSEVEDAPPGRLYRVADIEGHRWMFMQRT
jgi:PhnB protein